VEVIYFKEEKLIVLVITLEQKRRVFIDL